MDEKKLTDKIRQSAKNADVPESLSPENIQKKLEAEKAASGGEKKKYSFFRKYGVQMAEAAAAIVLIFAVGRQVGITEGRQAGVAENRGIVSEQPETVSQDLQKTASGDARMAETSKEAGASKEAAENMPEQQTAEIEEDLQEGILPVGSEEVLYSKLKEYQDSRMEYGMKTTALYGTAEMEESVMMDSAAGNSMGISGAAAMDTGADFSQTNLRELGVDEGDIVKTDGEYIYIMKRSSSVKIVSARGEKMTLVSTIEPESLDESVRDMYISGNTLNLVTGGSRSSMVEEDTDTYRTEYYDYAKVLTYDISSREAPVLLGSVEQEGYYHSSRKVGDYVYLFTQYQPVVKETQSDSSIMPLVNGSLLRAEDIYVPEELQNTSYLVIGAVNVNQPSEMAEHKAVVSGAGQFYVSGQSIYVCCREWKNGTGDVTKIMKFSYKDGKIRGIGIAEIKGYLNDTFSLDEYDGYLRVVATDWNEGNEINALYVYDAQMELKGKIADIAPGETIRSARFFGDTGYFVTFKQTDPLFSVDLSDPANPEIIGSLKVTGFSSYLHFYGENRLLGIGYEADENTGATTGIKLSMFDISDPSDVKEIKRYVIKDASYCAGLNNYRAIMADPEKNLFGFVCDNNYLVFSYDEEEGFVNHLTYNLSEGENRRYYWYAYDDMRGLYIGETFYLANSDKIRAFDMTEDFAQKAKLEF